MLFAPAPTGLWQLTAHSHDGVRAARGHESQGTQACFGLKVKFVASNPASR